MIYFVARHYVRATSSTFGVLSLLGCLLRVAFVALVTLWVYVDSKKHERNTLFWTGFTVVTHGFAWVIYMIMREPRRASRSNA